MDDDRPSSPLGVIFYFAGGLAIAIGCVMIASGMSEQRLPDTNVILAFSVIGSGLLFLAIGSVLFHLRRMEHHLFKMREAQHLKDKAATKVAAANA